MQDAENLFPYSHIGINNLCLPGRREGIKRRLLPTVPLLPLRDRGPATATEMATAPPGMLKTAVTVSCEAWVTDNPLIVPSVTLIDMTPGGGGGGASESRVKVTSRFAVRWG